VPVVHPSTSAELPSFRGSPGAWWKTGQANEGDGEGADNDDLMAELAEIRREPRVPRDEGVARANPANGDR
jgi:hypothetical protein